MIEDFWKKIWLLHERNVGSHRYVQQIVSRRKTHQTVHRVNQTNHFGCQSASIFWDHPISGKKSSFSAEKYTQTTKHYFGRMKWYDKA